MYLNFRKILKPQFWETRLLWAKLFYLFVLTLLFLRLFYLQVIKHRYYLRKAKQRSIVRYVLKAPRGQIITADGVVVATNRAVFQLYVDIDAIKGKEDKVFLRLSKLLGESFGELKERYAFGKKYSFGRVLIKRNLKWDELAKIITRLYYLPGVSIEVESERYYPWGKPYFHLVGYVAKISKREYLRKRDEGYSIEDYIGRRGVERAFERVLKGVNGYIEVEKDAYGRLGKIINRVEPRPGDDVILTVKHKYQMEAYKLLRKKSGAFVALSPTGALLAMVSTPSVDSQKFIEGFSYKEWRKIQKNPAHPLTNKALSPYPPGSTFKVITAFAGLEAGVIKSTSQTIYCPGYFIYKKRRFGCWKRHGNVNFFKAIYESCDTYFYWVASNLDVDFLANIAKEFGLGEKSGLNWAEERQGTVPSREWKKRVFKTVWYPGETLHFAIGQGYLTATPLQMARVYMAIANGGKLYKVWVVKAIRDPISKKEEDFSPIIERKIVPKDKRTFQWIQKALVETVQKGTGKSARVKGLLVAGKTGTAQVISSKWLKEKKGRRWEHHAWFVSYAGRRAPEIITAILIEHGGHGGSAAAPIAGEFYKNCFNMTSESNHENR